MVLRVPESNRAITHSITHRSENSGALERRRGASDSRMVIAIEMQSGGNSED
jgi:hypothetical protein